MLVVGQIPERLKADAPEFEQLTAFQAGGFRVSVRRPGVDVAARSLRTEYVTGNYFTTFGILLWGAPSFFQLSSSRLIDSRLTSTIRSPECATLTPIGAREEPGTAKVTS